ncbi:hypothetical protein GA0061096_1400 [Fictibacillus enclensis]|uniref:hypothetical protein n=1 Tax=Fictibacillus enclensis TaxID=1017270 RepID=UPI0008161C06|nr:hypothetical protein [Fictibacillus enclensis]SCB92480.1 hypothetical protein GA0061096_1400 [Fictibacillus enclensis]
MKFKKGLKENDDTLINKLFEQNEGWVNVWTSLNEYPELGIKLRGALEFKLHSMI